MTEEPEESAETWSENKVGKLQEISRTDIGISRGGVFHATWTDSTLSICTDSSLQILELTCNLDSFVQSVDATSSCVPCPSAAPVSNLINSISDSQILESKDLQRRIDPVMWSHNETVAEEMSMITQFEWSPCDLGGRRCLAVLSCQGCVSIYTRRQYSMPLLLNLTETIVQGKTFCKTNNIDDIKSHCKEVQSTSICWGATINANECMFITAQKTGKVMFWKISFFNDKSNIGIEVIGDFDPGIGEIKTLTNINKNDNRFALVCSSFNGMIIISDFKIDDNRVCVNCTTTLWPHRDSMVLNHVGYHSNGSEFVVVCAKHRYLLIFLLNKENDLISQYVNNVNDHTISAMTKTNGNIYIGTDKLEVYKLCINIVNDSINVEYNKLLLKEDLSEFKLCDIAVTNNGAIWAFTVVKKTRERIIKNCVTVIYLRSQDLDILNLLIKNPLEVLTNMWDCVELLRIQLLKDRSLPSADCENVFSDPNLSSYLRKLYIILWKLYHKCDFIRNIPKDSIFSNITPEIMKETILLSHAIDLINTLHQIHHTIGELQNFQRNTLLGCYKFVEFYCSKKGCCLSDFLNGKMLTFAETQTVNTTYKCQYCEQDLEGYLCKDNHPNQFCCVSLQPITQIDYLACRLCGSAAHPDLAPERPYCVFCDVVMECYSL